MATEATLLQCLTALFPANVISGLPALVLGEDEFQWGGAQTWPHFIINMHSEDPVAETYVESGFAGEIWGRFTLNIWTQDASGSVAKADSFAKAVMAMLPMNALQAVTGGLQLGANPTSQLYRERYNCRTEGRDSQERVIAHATIRYRVEFSHSDH